LRKYLIAALAACVAVGVVAVSAPAQDPSGIELKVNLVPPKSGTKKKPKSTKIHFVTTNKDVSQTADRIKIWIPKTLKVSNKGFPKCTRTGVRMPARRAPRSAAAPRLRVPA
jgi:hypothetical protein